MFTIMGLGPQQHILSNSSRCNTLCCVTKPFSPKVPSSVVIHTRPIRSKLSFMRMSFAERPPKRNVGTPPKRLISEPK